MTKMTWFNRISRPGSMVSGVQISPPVSTVSAGGAIPTIVVSTPLSASVRPTRAGSLPKRRFQIPSPIIATGTAPGFSSSSANERPAHRRQAEQRHQRRAEPPARELLRFSVAAHAEGPEADRGELQGLRLLLPRQVVQERGGEDRQPHRVVLLGHLHQPLRRRERQ